MKTSFRIPILNVDVDIIVGSNLIKITKELLSDHGETRPDSWFDVLKHSQACAFCITEDRMYYGLAFKNKGLCDELVAHEAWHLVWGICNGSGIKVKNNETCACLMGYIVGQVTSSLLADAPAKSKISSKRKS